MGTTIKWILLAACLWKPLWGQDLRLWVGASAKQSVHRKVDLGLEFQHRWQGMNGQIDAFFLEPSVGYEPVRNLQLGFAWRVSNTLDEATDVWHLRHRPQIDLELRHRFKRWRPFVRFRYQARYNTLGGENKPWLMHGRTKAGIRYSWLGGKGNNTLFGECWWPLNRSGRQQPDRYRLGLSTSIQLSKRHEISLQLAFEERFRSGPNPQSFIVGVFYSFRSAEVD